MEEKDIPFHPSCFPFRLCMSAKERTEKEEEMYPPSMHYAPAGYILVTPVRW